MKAPERNLLEVIAGLIWVGLGIAAVVIAQNYDFGTITRMGPGFVPTMIGILLIIFGLVAAWQGRKLPKFPIDIRFRAFACIMGGIIVWVILIDRVGFVPSTIALILISAQAERDMKLIESVLLAAAITLIGYLIFIRGIGIPIAAFGS